MGKTVSASAISEYLSDERASKKKKTIKLSAPEYKYNDDLESGALDIAKGVGQAASLVMLPSGIASITRGVGKVTGKRNETAEKVTSALAMPSAKMWQGFTGAAEGISDFLAGGATQIAGAVSKNEDVKDAAKWIYEHSWSSELSGAKDVDETLKNDSTAYRVTGDVLSGIGNVAFQMGLAMLTMGAANAATAAGSAGALAGNSGMSVGLAKGITYGSLFASAAGSGTAESMSKTGDLGWIENLSGVLKGGVEVATELISPTGQLIGTKFLENAAAKGSAEAAKKLAAKTMGESIKVSTKRALAKKLVSNFAGEATEEMLSYAGGWLIENKLNISDEKFSVQEMLYEGLMGGIAGSIFSSPADVHMFHVNKSTGAAVYAKGDAYAQGKINEGLTLVKLYKEKGVKGGAIDLAEAALTKLATDETLSQTQKEYYMGLAENVVLKTDLSETAKQYATALAERAAADPSYAESVANSLNAIVNEAGGKGEYTAADIANKDSGATRIVTLSQMLSDFVNPSADERIIHSFIDAANNATDWNNSAEQLDAVRNLQVGEDQQLVYKVDYVKDGDVYAVVKKRVDPKTGKESYSLAYTTTGQITSEDPQLYPMHDLSYDEVTSFLEGGLYSEQEVDQMIAEEQDRRETEAEQRREREQARNAEQKPNRKKKKKNAKKNAQTEQTGDQTQANRATQEDLSAFERSMMPKLGIDNSDFTQDEWVTARECIPNIDNLTRREQARILTLVRTANATGQNAEYVKGLARLSAAFGFGVVFYPDTKASGFYQRGNDMVFINPGNLDVTYGHEIQHSYDQEQKNGVAVYRTDLIDAVKKIVGEKVFEKAKAQYKADYEAFRKETGVRPISDAELEGEASANVVGKYLSNMTLLKKIAATDYSLGRGLLAAIRRMKDKWTSAKAFAKENDSTAFAEYRKMTRIENLLMKELGYNKAVNAKNGKLIEFTDGNGTVSYNVKTYREKSVIEDGVRKSGREILEARLKKQGYSDSDVVQFLNRLDAVADEMERLAGRFPILNKWNNVELTYKDNQLIFSALVRNGEYEINFDFSTVCKHREAFTKVLNKIVEIGRGGELNLTPKKIAQINAILKHEGFETACKMCFVEGKRNGIKNWANTFVNGRDDKKGWNYYVRQVYGDDVEYADFGIGDLSDEEVLKISNMLEQDLAKVAEIEQEIQARYDAAKNAPKPKPVKENINEMMFKLIKSNKQYAFLLKPENLYGSKGVTQLNRMFPEVYSILNRSYGQGAPKITLEATPYGNEFQELAKSKGAKALADETFHLGGARLQSFSDYQMIRFLDYCQLIANGASIGAAMQCYTKEIDMVHLFGLTGMKINMSLVPTLDDSGRGDYAGLKKNSDGSWDYAIATESIQPYDYVDDKGVTRHGAFWYQNQEGYKENCGTILIGVSKYQILKAMADPNIRMIIPYHKSGLSGEMAELLGIATTDDKGNVINKFTDYEEKNLQHTRRADGSAVSKDFDFYEAYIRLKGDAKRACIEYLQWCDEHGYMPKFHDATPKTEGFVFLKNAPQKGYKYTFTAKDGTARYMNENYYKLIEDFSCYDGDGVAHQQRAVDLVLPDDWTEVVYRGLDEAQNVDNKLSEKIGSIIDAVFEAKESESNKSVWERSTNLEAQKKKPGFTKPSDTSYSPAPVTPETDSRYLSLARDPQKNESELRRLVKEAAEKAGYRYLRRTNKSLSPANNGADYFMFVTDSTTQSLTNYGKHLYVASDEGSTNIKELVPAIEKAWVEFADENGYDETLTDNEIDPSDIVMSAGVWDNIDFVGFLFEKGFLDYDIKSIKTNDGLIVFDKDSIKSADPVTYDDSGNIIPLSERFNPQNDDIRYSPAPSGSGRIVIQASQSRPNVREKLTNLKGELSRSNFRAALESLQVIAVNAQQGVENQLVRAGMTKREAAAFSQFARSGRSHAINAICYKLADMTGAIRSEGLIPILEPFLATKGEVYPAVDKDGNTVQSTAKGGELAGKRYSDFSDYYAMLHAIDRAAVGKNPYSSMTVAQMKQIVADYEQKNPDFKAAAEKLSAFNSAMLDIEVQAGIISQETADLWRKQYPHYVPMYTQDSNAVGGKPVRGSRNMEVRRDNAAATESDHRVSDPLRNYIDQVQRRIRAAKLNILLNEVYNSADGVNVVTAEADRAEAKDLRERERAYLENPESENDPAEMFRKFKRGKNTVNEVSFYKDGRRVTMAVTDRIYTGLSDLGGIHSSILDSWTVKAVKKVNDTFKKLVTNWNPFFAVKNIARDLQDGTLQSRFGMGEFLNMYRKNAEMMATGKYNDMWEEFLANGGLESSLYSDEFGTFTKGGKSGLEQATGIVGQFQHIKNFNTLTEALPRFTEYCLTRKHGGTVQTALLNAADVTVNFGRSGTLIRILNSTVSPFLNPAVQGLDRVIRLFTEEGIKNNKALASLLLKAVLLAIVPMALGNAMYGDDDEYKDMKDSVKENNYLFKIGDTWLKLPRGRVVSTISGLFNRSYKQLTGQETDWGDYGKNVLDQITPAQNVARHIGSPFMDVANNRTWYGTKIESDALQNYAVNQRYDENTSRISVWIGQLTSHFGLSPKEVNYLIDQYTGVIGDILLPTTTPAGTKGVVSYNFTVDPNTSSNLSNRFYDLYNKTMYKSNDGDVEAYYLKKRLDETKSAVSELFKQIKTINASSELSNKEKVKQASAIRSTINQLYKTALDDRRLYEQNIKDALAIENSYAVEKITAQSAKRYGLDSDAVGKYALTFGGEFVKKYDTEAQANDYKADASKKTVYAEANRLTYGAEYALREYNSNVYEKAQKLNELGISYDEYYNFYMTARYYSGKTKKDKILAYLNGSGLSKSQIALMMYYSGYSAYADEAKKAIKASSLSAERKKELLAGITH